MAADMENFQRAEVCQTWYNTRTWCLHGNLARFDYSVKSRETKNFSPIPLNFFFNLLWLEPWPETASQLHCSHFRVVKTHSEIIERGDHKSCLSLWSAECLWILHVVSVCISCSVKKRFTHQWVKPKCLWFTGVCPVSVSHHSFFKLPRVECLWKVLVWQTGNVVMDRYEIWQSIWTNLLVRKQQMSFFFLFLAF